VFKLFIYLLINYLFFFLHYLNDVVITVIKKPSHQFEPVNRRFGSGPQLRDPEHEWNGQQIWTCHSMQAV